MSRLLLAILLVAPVIYAKIEIDVKASKNVGENMVRYHGQNEEVITDMEQDTFNLKEEELKTYIEKYFGARPTDAFLKSPTPWGDLYKVYKWQQVKKSLTAQKARILSSDSEPTVITKKSLDYRNVDDATFKLKLDDAIQVNVSSVWTKDSVLSAEKDIKYDFNIIMKGGKPKHVAYTAKWGENVVKSIPADVETEYEIFLQTPHTLVAELLAVKNTMKVQVDYEATLHGVTAVYYADGFKGHQFWSLDIQKVMGGVKPVHSSELIDVTYYTNMRVVIRDVETDSILYTIHLRDH